MRALRDFRLLAKESKRRNREIEERVDQQTRQLEAKLTAEFTVSVLPSGTVVHKPSFSLVKLPFAWPGLKRSGLGQHACGVFKIPPYRLPRQN